MDSFTEDHFLGTVTVEAGKNAIQTTLAYDPGWNVTVDGVPVETYKTLNALLAFDVEEGEHTVELRYFPKEYKFSLVLFAGGCALFLAILVWDFVLTRKRKKTAALASAEENTLETNVSLQDSETPEQETPKEDRSPEERSSEEGPSEGDSSPDNS